VRLRGISIFLVEGRILRRVKQRGRPRVRDLHSPKRRLMTDNGGRVDGRDGGSGEDVKKVKVPGPPDLGVRYKEAGSHRCGWVLVR
jgi:hypothetical protein